MADVTLATRDAEARARALDTATSFIVRAPAGSGKTELLIQRVLALLATVDSPEEVVAITFTRKAAAEMRQRVLAALEAARGAAPEPPHERTTWSLARAVLARDSERGWDLVHQPARLRIQTIDALAQWLARQLPLALGLGAMPTITERADALYAAAARATFATLESPHRGDRELAAHVARLLVHLDADVETATGLLASMLGRRDQWLRHLGDNAREELEAPLQRACERQMQRVCELLPAHLADDLVELARYAAGNGASDGPLSPCADLTELPGAEAHRLEAWCALAGLLLTKEGQWRAQFTKREGFPAGQTPGERQQAQPYRERIASLVDSLRTNEALREALHDLRGLPLPRFTDRQWNIAESIAAVLRRAAAELAVAFAEAGAMDFAEVTQRAVRALGDPAAGDMAVALDARVRHLLIDEFQDTSITQFELVERLVADWSAGDGRTLFVVGDPMQSIYRFREAEVGLFLRAWERGLGPVGLARLQLTRNFRSNAGIVEWVNHAFARVLPRASDITSGAVSFEPAVAADSTVVTDAVQVHAFVGDGAEDEARRVATLVQSIRAESATATIALLVRARTHLVDIAAELQRAGLKPTAVELHSLARRPLISDLLALTRALDHLGDRVAWLAVLRAPWCGLTLADLTALAEGDPRTVFELMGDEDVLRRLAPDGRARIARVRPVLARAVDLAARMGSAERVEQTWILLGGPACVRSQEESADAEQFFAHLAAHEEECGGRIDTSRLQQSIESLYAAPGSDTDAAFCVMTIHKAKGLEFDHVIVPRLGAVPRGNDTPLMAWLERETDAGPELLVAPIHARGADKDRLLRWVEAQLQQRQRHEDERLAYVAATRARQRLHLIGSASRDAAGEWSVAGASLLARLWPVLEPAFERGAVVAGDAAASELQALDQSLRRLPAGWTLPALPSGVPWTPAPVPAEGTVNVEFSWAGETARRVGVVVHRWLQRMAEDALAGWDAARVTAIVPHIERALAAGGLSGAALSAARARATQALVNVLQDDRGRWVLGAHSEHSSELRLSAVQGGRVRRFVVDRTFVAADGQRWIVDYKVGSHEGADTRAFLDSEQVRYRAQLEDYGAALDPAARLGLYFPLVPGWREWSQTPNPGEPLAPTDIIPDGGPPRTEVP